MAWREKAQRWKGFGELNQELIQELEALYKDEKGLEDAFYKDLEFGTGGMRGEIGVGTNRINIYTIRKCSAGLGAYIETFGDEAKKRGVVIAYDSRHKSKEFALEAAKTLASMGIMTYVFTDLRPTPELSFAVRHLHAFSGIVITASHNPPEYNGFKVYGPDGGQVTTKAAEAIISKVNEISNELMIQVEDEKVLKEKGLLKIIGEEIDKAYIENLKQISENPGIAEKSDIQIVFTPLHGTANIPLRRAMSTLGYQNIHIVKEQEQPDPNFSTVKSPNPEEHAAFELAIQKGKDVNADILIATDPDADRLGIAVKNEHGEYVVLTGNQTGALILYYLLTQKNEKGTLPSNSVLVKTIVTSELGTEIARAFNVEIVNVLTGFKYIGEKIKEYEETGQYTYLFGYEESYGYLIADFVRDKDAIQAAVLVSEACAYYKEQEMSLYQVLLSIYEQFGYYREGLRSLTLKGKSGAETIQQLLTAFRNQPLDVLGNRTVVRKEDYLTGIRTLKDGSKETIQLPQSNVIKYFFDDGSWVCIRPSGTEPKIKFYFGVTAQTYNESNQALQEIQQQFMKLVDDRIS